MPHVIVKLWPGKSEDQKKRLARPSPGAFGTLGYGDDAVSVAFEEVSAEAWKQEVYEPDILAKAPTLYKKPGYRM